MRKLDDDFGRIRRELSELAATGREALGNVNLTEKLGNLALDCVTIKKWLLPI